MIAVLLTFTFAMGCSLPTREEFCADTNHGLTTFRGRVLDFYTHKPIDSVEIRIVYGISWDRYLDTTIVQGDSLHFALNIADDCEDFFFTLSNKHYWVDFRNDSLNYKTSVNKGGLNEFEINLRPATFFKLSVTRDTLNQASDTVLLQIRKKGEQWENWKDFSADNFRKPITDLFRIHYSFSDSGTYRTTSTYYDFEGNTNYDVRWVRRDEVPLDTIYNRVQAKPFDTVQLHYDFKAHTPPN